MVFSPHPANFAGGIDAALEANNQLTRKAKGRPCLEIIKNQTLTDTEDEPTTPKFPSLPKTKSTDLGASATSVFWRPRCQGAKGHSNSETLRLSASSFTSVIQLVASQYMKDLEGLGDGDVPNVRVV